MSERARPWLKICGVTTEEDARLVADAGADAIGLNFVSSSKRYLDQASARKVADAVRGRVELVGVVANQTADELRALAERLGLDFLQLHGDEPPSFLVDLPQAFKAVGIAGQEDAARAALYAGERLLVDAKHGGAFGGTGQRFDWNLVRSLAEGRRLILAGGLTPENVAEAVRTVHPWGLDVASGVEGRDPRRKDPEKVARFIENARRAEKDPSG